ncbi:MAG: hypothetical protein V1889_00940 [archaeon]
MKKVLIVLLVIGLIFGGLIFVEGGNAFVGVSPEGGSDSGDVDTVNAFVGNYSPLDDSGKVNFSKYSPFKSKAEERIAEINKYVGPVTKVLWGVELELSWVFVFSFIVWILLIVFIIVPVSSIFDWGIWWSLIGAGIIATLAMQGFGKDLVVWMNSLMTQWWIGFIVLGFAVIVGVIYSLIFKSVGLMAKKAKEKSDADKTARDRKILAVEAKLIKDSLGK